MNFGRVELSADTVAFWADVRAFFDKHVTEETHEEERRTGGGFSEPLHLAMGERGWVAPRWPVEEGGAGLDDIRARILRLELARSRAPMILAGTTLLPPVAIRLYGSDKLKMATLPGIADGSVRICLGYTEPDCGSDLAAVRTRAVRDGDDWVINGQKMFTTGAQHSQFCFCLTRTNVDVPKHKGLTVFVVPLSLLGVEIRPIETLGGERTNFVHFDDVHVADEFRVGEVDAGWSVIAAPLAAEHHMGDEPAALGGPYLDELVRIRDAFTAWAADAPTDGGGRVIDDPTVREAIAEITVGVELALLTPGPMGRILESDLLVAGASRLLDLVGPASLLERGADGAVQCGIPQEGFRSAPGTAIYGGSTDIARNMVAERLLGLPRSTPRG